MPNPLTPYGESLFFFPKQEKSYTLFFGIGMVKKITHGEDFDVVIMTFGLQFGRTRTLIVIDNHARKQIITLKRGQVALVYGASVTKYTGNIIKSKFNDEPIKEKKTVMYVYMLQGMYVPRSFDIKKRAKDIEKGIEENHIDIMSDKVKNALQQEVDIILDNGRLKDIECD